MRFIGALLVAGLALAGFLPEPARAADSYPSHQVRMVMPFPPGSSTDITARIMADELTKKWGQPVVVDNVVGAGGNIGSSVVFRANPDGYTLLFAPPPPFTTNPFLYKNPGYDYKRWSPITLVTKVPYVLSARPNFPGNNVQDLIRYAKENPGKATYASAGVGSTIQLYAVELAQRTGTNMVHVPYRGAAPALTDVMAGHVDFLFDVIATSLPVWKDGKVKVLGVGSETRSPSMPDIPTIAEQGLPGFTAITWFAIVGPPNMPQALIDKINKDVGDILRKPDVIARYGKLLMEPMIASPADTQKFFDEEAERWGKLMKSAGINAIE